MNLFSMCINVLAKPDIIQMYSNQLEMIPLNIKVEIFTILCKRGYISDVKIVKHLLNPSITNMDLSECVVTNEILSCISCCENLRKLDLSLRRRQTRFVTSEVLMTIFQHLPLLQIIAIPHCKEVTDNVIAAISQNCNHLIELHIPHSSITDHGLRLIGDHLHHLAVINLLGSQITDIGIQYLLRGKLSKSLTEINIDKCPGVTLLSNTEIDQHCPNIKIFTCGAFTELEESGLTMNRIRSKAKQLFWSV